MEYILHVSYRLDFCKSAAVTELEKQLMGAAKKRICEDFRKKMGLIVDKPKHGHGSSNNGNTARRFFADFESTLEISIILQALTCGKPIDTQKFQVFALETARLFVKLYPLYASDSS